MTEMSSCIEIQNIEGVSKKLREFINHEIKNQGKKGVVIGLSGGIDSSVTATLSKEVLGNDKVLGIILPEKESSNDSKRLALSLAKKLEIKTEIVDITKILDDFGVYRIREEIVKKYFPEYEHECKYSLAVSNQAVLNGGLRIPFLKVQDKKMNIHQFKIKPEDFSVLMSATSIKHRTRMTMLYFFAEQNNFAVMGSTNKSEYIQGYFVKYGDGGVDIEPILNLYKTQVYQLGRYLKIPEEIFQRQASPDTWSLEINDKDFFYGVDYKTLDLIWYAKEHKIPIKEISELVNYDKTQIENLTSYLEKRWDITSHMRKIPPSLELSL